MVYDKKQIIACVDISSNKVSSLIGGRDENSNPIVLGYGVCETEGFQNGKVCDVRMLASCITKSLSLAEGQAKHHIKSVVISLSGIPFKSFNMDSKLGFNFDKIITIKDLERCAERLPIQKYIKNDDLSVVHVVPIKYVLDGKKEVVNPIGLTASILQVVYHVIAVDSLLQNDLVEVIKRCNLDIKDVVVNPYADGLACLVDDDKRIGSMIVDIGKSSTYLGIFYQNNFCFSIFIPMGGDYITNYICKKTNIKFDIAEGLKIKYGAMLPLPIDYSQTISVLVIASNGEDEIQDFVKADILNIINPVVNMLVNIIKNVIVDKNLIHLVNRIVITGGGANIKGIKNIFEDVFDLPVRLAKPIKLNESDDDIYSFENATLIGILYFYILKSASIKNDVNVIKNNSFFSKVKKFINDNF